MHRPLLAFFAAVLTALTIAPAAHAEWFPPDVVDGPGPVVAFADIDIARDGAGAVVYLKHDDGVPHVFLSRLIGGAWQPPVRVDAGIGAAAEAASVGVSDGGRLAVAWMAAGTLYGASVQGGADQALSGPRALFADPARAISVLDAEMGLNGTAYVAFGAGADLGAVRLEDDRWEVVPGTLDVDRSQAAGEGARRPRVVVGAEGNAVVAWGESHADGRSRVYARRITGLRISAFPQEASVPAFGPLAGGAADSPDLSAEEDGSFLWVVWRQDLGGVSRSLARRMRGTLFDEPVVIDGGNASTSPRVSIDGNGGGYAVMAVADASAWGSMLRRDVFAPAVRLDRSGSVIDPVVATSDWRTNAVAWHRGGAELWGRERETDRDFGGETRLSAPGYGPLAGPYGIGSDRVGDVAVAFTQGDAGARRLLVTSWDRPPSDPVGRTPTTFRPKPQPTLRWDAGPQLWGPLSFQVVIDGVESGSTAERKHAVAAPLADGEHQWFVRSIDRRGQVTVSKPRVLRIDTVAPTVKLSTSGRRKVRRPVRFRIAAADGTSGIASVQIDFGDGTPAVKRRGGTLNVGHPYARRGAYRVAARTVDKAGHTAVDTLDIRVRK